VQVGLLYQSSFLWRNVTLAFFHVCRCFLCVTGAIAILLLKTLCFALDHGRLVRRAVINLQCEIALKMRCDIGSASNHVTIRPSTPSHLRMLPAGMLAAPQTCLRAQRALNVAGKVET
jgi:hypothetical protein